MIKSVHLTTFPIAANLTCNEEIVKLIDKVREICNVGLAIRSQNNIRTRQPLADITIFANTETAEKLKQFSSIIEDELNLKQVLFAAFSDDLVEKKIFIDRPKLGKRLGSKLKDVIDGVNKNIYSENGENIIIANEEIFADEFKIIIKQKTNPQSSMALSSNDILLSLNLNLTNELINEGLARDFIRAVQQSRKDFNLNIQDRINIAFEGDDKILKAVKAFESYIKQQTLAENMTFNNNNLHHKVNVEIDGIKINLSFEKI